MEHPKDDIVYSMDRLEQRREELQRAETVLTEEEQLRRQNERMLAAHRQLLRQHMGLPGKPGGPVPRPPYNMAGFFIEKGVATARCNGPFCRDPVLPGDYRFALAPAMALDNPKRGKLGSADLYHIRCFEEIADFSDSAFLSRLYPVTRETYELRVYQGTGILGGKYLLDAGAESLVTVWSSTRERLIRERDGVHTEVSQAEKDFTELLFKAGTPGFQASQPEGMSITEYFQRLTTLAPVESDGPDDTEPWDMLKRYLDGSPDSLNNKHELSRSLELWGTDCRMFNISLDLDDESPEVQAQIQEWKDEIGPKGLRALKRMTVKLLPNMLGY